LGGTLCKIGSPLLSFLLCSLCTPLQDRVFESFEEFQTAIIIDNKNILQLEKPLEILRAGIIDNEPMLKTPWGDKRLADKAVNK
jgi:hypothetical protein